MNSSATRLAKLRDRIQQLDLMLDEARALRAIAATEHWHHLERAIGRGILARINMVCDIECGDRDTVVHRAEIRALRWFLRIPQISEQELEKAAITVKGLRDRVDRMHNLGLGQEHTAAAEVLAEVDSVERKLQGTS